MSDQIQQILARLQDLETRLSYLEEQREIGAQLKSLQSAEPAAKPQTGPETEPGKIEVKVNPAEPSVPPELPPAPKPKYSFPQPTGPGWDDGNAMGDAFAGVKKFFSTGNPLNKVGAVTLLISAGLFFKVAVDNDWIGPSGRVVLGILCGVVLLAFGERCQKKSLTNLASGFLGAGQGIIFIAIYNAQHRYELIPPLIAFAIDVMLTALVLAQSLRFNSQAVALMGLLGGFITPILASSGSNDFFSLSVYLLLLNTGVLAISYYRNWSALKWLAFTFTELYLLAWADAYKSTRFNEERHFSLELSWLIPAISVFFCYFTAIPIYRSLKHKQRFAVSDIYLTVTNGVVSFGLIYLLLRGEHRAYLGLVAVAVAAVYFFLCGKLLASAPDDKRAFQTMLGAGAWYLFAAVPMIVSGHYITIVWSLEAAAVAWYSIRTPVPMLYQHVYGLLFLVCIRLAAWDRLLTDRYLPEGEKYIPFGDPATLSGAVAAASMYFILRISEKSDLWKQKISGLWLGAAAVLLISVFQELRLFSYNFLAAGMPGGLVDAIFFSLWAAFAFWIGILTLRAIEQHQRLRYFVEIFLIGCLLAAIGVLWSPPVVYYYMEELDLGRAAWLEQVVVAGLAVLAFLSMQQLRNVLDAQPQSGGNLGKRPLILALAVLGVIIVVIRRECYALIFLPPLSEMIASNSRPAVYQMVLSCAYSLISFCLYLRGVSTGRRVVVYVAYGLFALTGVKVYLYDLASASQIYRALSFFVFGVVLLASEFLKQRILEKRAPEQSNAGV